MGVGDVKLYTRSLDGYPLVSMDLDLAFPGSNPSFPMLNSLGVSHLMASVFPSVK